MKELQNTSVLLCSLDLHFHIISVSRNSYRSKLERCMISFSLNIAWSRVYKGQGTASNKLICDIMRERKRHLKDGVCISTVHVLYIDMHTRAVQAHAHMRMCAHEDTKRSQPPAQQWKAWKEETPNMHLGYKLGAVIITMYINSHTSF